MPTERHPATSTYLSGIVHDENARFLGGVSGNAGLFSSLDDCIIFGRVLLGGCSDFLPRHLFDMMVKNWTPGMEEARGLGVSIWNGNEDWSGGTCLGHGAYGHTGFTGTSIFVSPQHNLFFVLLTNRVKLGRGLEILPRYRAQFHEAVLEDFLGFAR